MLAFGCKELLKLRSKRKLPYRKMSKHINIQFTDEIVMVSHTKRYFQMHKESRKSINAISFYSSDKQNEKAETPITGKGIAYSYRLLVKILKAKEF